MTIIKRNGVYIASYQDIIVMADDFRKAVSELLKIIYQ